MFQQVSVSKISSFAKGSLRDAVVFSKKDGLDYSPYGTLLHHRHGAQTGSDSYRYAFQGQEKDDEIKGEGNSYNYTFRMHDPRIGRFFARDPLSWKYPFYSPYSFSGNRLIDSRELEGLEPVKANEQVVFILPQSRITTVVNSEKVISYGLGSIQINPDNLGWMAQKSFYNKLYDQGKSLGGPPRNIANYTLFKPSIGTDRVSTGPASLNGGSEEAKDYPGQSMPVETPKRKDGQRDRRFKFRGAEITPNVPVAGSRGMGWAGLILATAELTYTSCESYNIISANEEINDQGNAATEALYDVHYAIQIGLVDQKYLNPADIAVIAQVFMTGTMTKSAQKYIFRSGGWQHLRKEDFSGTITYAQQLRIRLNDYIAEVNGSFFSAVSNMSVEKVVEDLKKYSTTKPQ